MDPERIAEQVEALRLGRGFADLSPWRKVLVGGAEAIPWLNDLLTAELADLSAGEARRALLLSPTGRIRADVTVARVEAGALLVQDPRQPAPIDALLAPYVLSSDVTLDDRTDHLALLAFPGGDPPRIEGGVAYAPSALGMGTDVVLPLEGRDRARAATAALVEAGEPALEGWRIERGMARFGADLGEDSLPHEADAEAAIAYGKGCFLGQEAVAKVRNLGHPPFVVLPVRADGAVEAGDAVVGPDGEAGRVTSAARGADGETAALARVRWGAREQPLRTADGTPLVARRIASGAA